MIEREHMTPNPRDLSGVLVAGTFEQRAAPPSSALGRSNAGSSKHWLPARYNKIPMEARVLAFVLAGGKGTRLYPLTKERAKPAVPFGGRYRIVDFVLSNLINSGIYSVYVLIQFKSQSLLQHLRDGWEVSGLLRQHFIIPVPAQMRSTGEDVVSRHGRCACIRTST